MREEAKSSEAIHLASAQDFYKRRLFDASFVSTELAKNPEENGAYLRKALAMKAKNPKEPKIPVMQALATLYDRGLSGNYMSNFDPVLNKHT